MRITPRLHDLRHSAGHIILLQQRFQLIGNRSRDSAVWCFFQIISEHFFTVRRKELGKAQRIKREKIDLADRKRLLLLNGNAKKRTGANDMILRGVFTKILQRRNGSAAFLYFIQNHEGIFRLDRFSSDQPQFKQDPVDVKIRIERLGKRIVLLEIKIRNVRITPFSERFEQIGFPALPHAHQDQRLALFLFFPGNQLGNHISFHSGISFPILLCYSYHIIKKRICQWI